MADAKKFIEIIYDIHHSIPNGDSVKYYAARDFMHHVGFLYWVYDRAKGELVRRGKNIWKIHELDDKYRGLRSLTLETLLPPTPRQIARAVVHFVRIWVKNVDYTGEHLPYSYIELAEAEDADFKAPKRFHKRTEQASKRHYYSDREWYSLSKEAPKHSV